MPKPKNQRGTDPRVKLSCWVDVATMDVIVSLSESMEKSKGSAVDVLVAAAMDAANQYNKLGKGRRA